MSTTEKQRKETYIRRKGICCLHCGSDDIENQPFEDDCTVKIDCGSCGKSWTEVYTLTDVVELN